VFFFVKLKEPQQTIQLAHNLVLNRLLLVVASALVPRFSGFDRARMRTCVFNYIWWFISLSCCIDIRYDLFCCFSHLHCHLLKLRGCYHLCLLGDFGFHSFCFVNKFCVSGRLGAKGVSREGG
jgi:hypothetical protein